MLVRRGEEWVHLFFTKTNKLMIIFRKLQFYLDNRKIIFTHFLYFSNIYSTMPHTIKPNKLQKTTVKNKSTPFYMYSLMYRLP